MTKLLRLWPLAVALLLLLLLAAAVGIALFMTAPDGPDLPREEAVPERVDEVPPSAVARPPREEPVRHQPAPKPASANREEGTLKGTVERFSGQLQYCYEKQLEVNPALEGRVEVGWTVSGGTVSGTPSIVQNTTGDAALADCISAKIRRWRFPDGVEGDVSWPFVFQPKK